MHRIRKLREERCYLFFESQAFQLDEPQIDSAKIRDLVAIPAFLQAHDINPVFTPGDLRKDGSWTYSQAQQPYLQVFLSHVEESIRAKYHYAHGVISGLKGHGYSMSYDFGVAKDGTDAKKELIKSMKRTKEQEIQMICSAKELDAFTADALRKSRLLTESEKASLKKFALKMAFKYDRDITPKWVNTYSGLEGVYNRLCQICPNQNENEAKRMELILCGARLDADADPYTAIKQTVQKQAYLHQLCAHMLKALGFEGVFSTHRVSASNRD